MLLGTYTYDKKRTIQITTTRKPQPKDKQTNEKQQYFFLSFLPVMKIRTVNIPAQKFNKHSYTKDSPEHDFICQSGSCASLP